MSQRNELKKVLQALVDKLEVVGKATEGIFTMAHVHGMSYVGPNYGKELAAAKKILKQDSKKR